MAATVARIVACREERAPILHDTLDATQTIFAGSIGVNVAGAARLYIANTAGQTLLGMAKQDHQNTTGAAVVFPVGNKMVFRRGALTLKNAAGGLAVTDTQLGKKVRLADEDTVSNAAVGGNDLSFTALRLSDDGLFVECQVE